MEDALEQGSSIDDRPQLNDFDKTEGNEEE